MKAAIIGALDIEHMGGGEANAVMISNLLIEEGFYVKYFGSGCPVDNSNLNKKEKLKFDYEPSAFSHDPFTKPLFLRISRLLSLGFIGIVNFKKTYEKVRGFDLYYFQNPTLLMRKLMPLLVKEGHRLIIANNGTYFEYLHRSNNFLLRILSKIATKFILDPIKIYRNEINIQTLNRFQTKFYLQNGFLAERILEIPQHNVDMSLFGIEPMQDQFHVAFLGRLTESKGVDILPDIIEMNPNMTFHIIGNGPLKERLLSTLKYKNVIIHGFVSEEDKRKILSQCDAMIIPSFFESLSIAAIEGLSSGLPLIGSDTASGLQYILSFDQFFGKLVARNSKAFTAALNELMLRKLTNSEFFTNDRKKRREIALNLFDKLAITLKISELVKRSIETNSPIKEVELEPISEV